VMAAVRGAEPSGAGGVAEQLALDVAGSASGKGFWTG